MLRTRVLPIVALMAVLTVAAGSTPRSASALAPTTQPWQSDVCFTSACVWSSIQSTYVAGGDGVSIQNYIDGGGSYGGNVAKIVERSRIVEAGAADVVPEVGTLLPLLGTITLGATAFEVGWKIGSTVNTKWLHLAGVGLGHTASDPNGLTATPQWVPSTNLHAVYSGFPAAVGWWLKFFNDGSTSYFDHNQPGCQTSNIQQAEYDWAHTGVGANIGVEVAVGPLCSGTATLYKRYLLASSNALSPDQGPVPYTNQLFGLSTGWKVGGGCGDTSTACGYPGPQQNPMPSAPHLRCELSGDGTNCGAGSPHACITPDGTGFFGGAGSTGCGLGPGPEGTLNCVADPVDFACPGTNGDGTEYGDGGGAIVDWAMPDCFGYLVADCEGLISMAAAEAHHASPSFSVTIVDSSAQDESTLPGGVVGQSIGAGSIGAPSALSFATNPDPMNGYSGSGGYGGSGGPPIAPPDDPCSFEEWGRTLWNAVRGADPVFYDQACADAWQAARDQGLVDDLNLPAGGWWNTAGIAVKGLYLWDQGAIDALTSDGSAITDWAKVKSPRFETSNGPAELHGYQNIKTGAFNSYDWKVVFVDPF